MIELSFVIHHLVVVAGAAVYLLTSLLKMPVLGGSQLATTTPSMGRCPGRALESSSLLSEAGVLPRAWSQNADFAAFYTQVLQTAGLARSTAESIPRL